MDSELPVPVPGRERVRRVQKYKYSECMVS